MQIPHPLQYFWSTYNFGIGSLNPIASCGSLWCQGNLRAFRFRDQQVIAHIRQIPDSQFLIPYFFASRLDDFRLMVF
jgi:hypothetical protein